MDHLTLNNQRHGTKSRPMINNTCLSSMEIADAAKCTRQTVTTIRSKMKRQDDSQASPPSAGPQRSITPLMLEALCSHLREHPYLY